MAVSVTLDQLIALNDEIAALVRAGVPLEGSLAEIGRDLPGGLGRFAAVLAQRTAEGKPLADVLADPELRLPVGYRAVVVAGIRAGRLPAALESLAGSMRRLAQTRRSVILALLYPLILVMVAWVLLAVFTSWTAPALLAMLQSVGARGAAALTPLMWCGRGAKIWGPIGPVVFLALAWLWWHRATRAAVVGSPCAWLFGWLPWLGPTLQWSHTAVFTEVLALLVENQVPLDEAVLLGGQSSGDRRVAEAADELAAAIRSGDGKRGTVPSSDQPGTDRNSETGGQSPFSRKGQPLPPLMCWLILGGGKQASFLPALKHMAETYRQRAQLQADIARIWLPIFFTLTIGGGVALFYGLSLFLPYVMMLKALASQ